MQTALADLAQRRPWALLAGNLVVLAVALIVALGTPDHLGVGSLALDDEAAPDGRGAGQSPDLVIATTGNQPVRSAVYRVALRVISSAVRSDAEVGALRRGPISADGRSTSLLVSLRPDDHGARQRAVERIEAGIDPGPLRLAFGGEVATLLDARHALSDDLWKLELLAVPFALLVLVGALGLRLAAAPVICAATAIAGALAGLRIAGALADVSLLGIAPAAVLGLVVGVEAPLLLIARFRDESALAEPNEALRRALDAGARAAAPLGLAAAAVTIGLLATPLDQAGSMVLASALAGGFALVSALVSVPALLALGGARAGGASGEPYPKGAPAAVAGFIARSPVRTGAIAVVAVAAMLAAASPLLHADSRPFSADDLPAGSQARAASTLVASGSRKGDAPSRGGKADAEGAHRQSIFPDLGLAAAVAAGALLIVLLLVFRSVRVVPVAVVTLLPAAAGCGICVLVFQDGHLASAIDQQRQGALETGAVASLVAGLGSVSAFRAIAAIQAARGERSLGLAPDRAAGAACTLTVPAAIGATVIGALATGVLAGSDLYSAREFGLAMAAGLVCDLVLLRVPLLATFARWGD